MRVTPIAVCLHILLLMCVWAHVDRVHSSSVYLRGYLNVQCTKRGPSAAQQSLELHSIQTTKPHKARHHSSLIALTHILMPLLLLIWGKTPRYIFQYMSLNQQLHLAAEAEEVLK